MEKDIYLHQIDYFKGARVLHTYEFPTAQEFKDDYFNVHEIHAIAICNYEGEESLLLYLDDDLEIANDLEFMLPKQAKEQAAQDFTGVDIKWKNR